MAFNNTMVDDGGSGGGETRQGYNPGTIETLENNVNDEWKKCSQRLQWKIDEYLFSPFFTIWYAPEARDELGKIGNALYKMSLSMEQGYVQLNDWIVAAGNTWAENVKGKKPEKISFTSSPMIFHNELRSVKDEDENGNIYLDVSEADKIADTMPELKSELIKIIEASHTAILELFNNPDLAPLKGSGQALAVAHCFNVVRDAFEQLFAVTEDIKEKVHNHAKFYREVARTNAQGLNSVTMNIDEEK